MGDKSNPTKSTAITSRRDGHLGIPGRVTRYAPPIARAGTAARKYHSKTGLPKSANTHRLDARFHEKMRAARIAAFSSPLTACLKELFTTRGIHAKLIQTRG